MAIESLSTEALLEGQEAYLHYLGGVAILFDPESDFSRGVHNLSVQPDNAEPILQHAENIMYRNLQRLILAVHDDLPVQRRRLEYVERRFEPAMPRLMEVIEAVYSENEAQIDRMNQAFFSLRPAPVIDRVVYHQLCHRRLEKLSTLRLLDDVRPSNFFGDLFGRTLVNIRGQRLGHFARATLRTES